ncbi:dTDP-4-amino-4,6-dideoxygalactose transaminase [Nocardioides euryhalodurans]|uniref:dTDP-4-amino-4,6-dideoxygalactose transaminase n=1 Tax=Nocardioides euryhalodurans TaxID=2518370 RepID=A0A4P7GN91_9ACTN|nr:dTDP-4-amino-4,6-dideoxygalactose transaminase [Nocardioides euryhalodurans]QBR93656.1 dTDP-4-amino-4,6-dideoxygalactose transaminase [Nocardioides euryhalodurans]
MSDIPFNRPEVTGQEMDLIGEAVASGHTSSGGPFSQRAGALLKEATGAQEVLLTTSCTDALELSCLLLDLGPGDTVVVPSFTFTSSALAFARQGARILFCDVEPDTLGLDPRHLAELLDDSVRAVVVVHYAGVACDIDGIRAALRDRPDVTIVEDAAHGLFGRWRDQPLGSLGRLSTLSFHETKNFICGEGGALLLNDPADVDRARVLYDKGTDRQAFFLGQVDKYSWRDTGSSFGMSDVLAAYLLAQLEQAESIQSRRRAVFEGYLGRLAGPAEELGLRLPVLPDHVDPAWHLFHVLLPDPGMRPGVMQAMREQGIATTFHYVPLHSSEGGRRFSARPTECPVSTDVSARLVRLPFFNTLTEADVARVSESLVAAVRATS